MAHSSHCYQSSGEIVLTFVLPNVVQTDQGTNCRSALATSQTKRKRYFDQRAVDRSFQPGDKVLLLLPVPGSVLSVKFSGPYVVEKKHSKTNYFIPDCRQPTRVHQLYNSLEHSCVQSVAQGKVATSVMASVSKVGMSLDEDGLVLQSADS